MKALLLHVMLILSQILHSQNILVEFDASDHSGISFKCELLANDTISEWKEKNQVSESGEVIFFVKNKIREKILMSEEILHKHFDVEDSLHQMKWEPLPETKNILGYTCNKARTHFRGRNYTAYYCGDIQLSDGPWKFGGLPGLILEVISEDGVYSFSAIKISNSTKKTDGYVNIEGKKFISWEEFAAKFRQTIDNWIKLARSNGAVDSNSEINIQISAMEIIYPKAQQPKGVDY